jgi:hypothetical protein
VYLSAISKLHQTLLLSQVLLSLNVEHGIGAVISAVQGKNLSHLMPKHI